MLGCDGTNNLLVAAQAVGVGRVIIVAGEKIYDLAVPEDLRLRESSPLRQVSRYAVSKILADLVACQTPVGEVPRCSYPRPIMNGQPRSESA